ncbi:MAG TPA: GyrI-like domain-containing protein [Terracidiphilus sp.]|jgi:predicted transcriptional regulator YdeE
MNLTEVPEVVHWPETYYVYVEKVGPFMENAPAAWGEAHGLLGELLEHNRVTGYMSLYKGEAQVYRAGFALEAPPSELPKGLTYELFPGGKYSKFTLIGPYTQLGPASGRVWQLVKELPIDARDDFAIENYVTDPRVTPAEELKTEIMVATK